MCTSNIKDTVNRTKTPTLLVTKCRLDKSNIEKKARHLFSDDLYSVYEVDATNEATLFENVYKLPDVDKLRAAIHMLSPKLQFDRLDGCKRMVWHIDKSILYNAL